jgi:hypothetical protein
MYKLLIILIIVLFIIYNNKSPEQFNTDKINFLINLKNNFTPLIINPGNKIAFIFLHTPNIYPYTEHTIKNLKLYIQKYNYTLIIYNNILDDNVAPCWNKVLAILLNIKDYDYVVWFDADAIITNHDKTIESIIEKEPDKDLYLCYDINKNKHCINSGVMIIANTDWTYNLFLNTWYNDIPHDHNDQNVLFIEIIKDSNIIMDPDEYSSYCITNLHPKIAFYESNYFNTNIFDYKKNDFILHLMGINMNSRISIMRQINTLLGFDDYHKTICIDFLNILDSPFSHLKAQYVHETCLSD